MFTLSAPQRVAWVGPPAAVPERAGGARTRRAERGRPGGGAAGPGGRRRPRSPSGSGVTPGSRAPGLERGEPRLPVRRCSSGLGTCPARLSRSLPRLLQRPRHPLRPPRPRGSRLQRRENEAGGGAARGPPGGRDGSRPRHHLRRPRAPGRGPGPSSAAPGAPPARPPAGRPYRPRPARRRRSRTRRRLPRAARPRRCLRCAALCAGPVWRSCSGPAPPRCATSLSLSRPRRSAG